ncbi:MAG TPA: uroporphyrinogen-III C-methyltransferase [Phycisphaerales bacterium]|nr:uroporphyrinogen-III C-methyltransferase [Phycisphaerales bacterium]
MSRQKHPGLAVLVGAGPGEAGLITVAGSQWLSRADAVVYDRLANEALLELCPAAARRIYVGKTPGRDGPSQDEINRLLVETCWQCSVVVRLKGGDPLVFGRGAEEADALSAAGVPFRIVPGVTAAVAAAACAGIPLTDRRAASSVAFVTGHEDPAKTESSLNWRALAGIDTVVFYMGVGNLETIARRFIEAGRAPDTPAAVVCNASSPRQRTVSGTLATIAQVVTAAKLAPPAVVIVGPTVAMRERLAWVEKLPLWGRTILVTRPRAQMPSLAAALTESGAEVLECPVLEIAPPVSPEVLDAALLRLGEFDWLVLTSANGVAAVFDRLDALGRDTRALACVRVAAIGPPTAEALRARGVRADMVARPHTTEALAEALIAAEEAAGGRFLLARADIATDTLPRMLRAAGAHVEEVSAYRTVRPVALPQHVMETLVAGAVDWITFTSASTVENFFAMAAGVDLSPVRLAAIGPVTAEALRARGLKPHAVADEHTAGGLAAAILNAEGDSSRGRTS